MASINGFFTVLANGLENLALSLSSGVISFEFLKKIIFFLRQTHNQMTLLLQSLPLSPGGTWVSEYMDESSALWEACSIAKSAINVLERESFSTAMKLTHLAKQPARALSLSRRAMATMEQEVRETLESINGHHLVSGFNGLRGALQAMKVVGFLLVKVFLRGLASWWEERENPNPNPNPHRGEERESLKGWGMVVEAGERFRRRVEEMIRVPAEEVRRVRDAVEEIQRERNGEGVEGLKAALLGLGGAADGISSEMDDLFDDMVEARKMVLDICSRS